jgi:bla regulator protein blaR1
LGKNACHTAIATILSICSIAAGYGFPPDPGPQPPTSGAIPRFEVATIKRNPSLAADTSMRAEPGGRFRVVNAPGFWLIAVAYSGPQGALRPSQIVGAPGWLESEHYDINAKAADAADMKTFEQSRLLLRSLLENRFNLRVHREQRQMPVYALVRVRPDGSLGPKFRQSTPDCLQESAKRAFAGGPVGHVRAGAITMDLLTQLLAGAADRIVVGRTGLSGGFEIDLEWSPDQTSTDKPSIFTAVQEQLGLKLESTRGPVDVVVIDHVERPTEE